MWLYNGKGLREGRGWTDDNGTQHPANWGRWSAEEKQERGLVWQDDPAPYDNKFYWSAGVPRDVEVLKADAIKTCKQQAAGMLQDSDWYIIRQSESAALGIPEDVLTYRQAVRDASNAIEEAINACTTHDEFMALYVTPADEEGNPTGTAPIYSFPVKEEDKPVIESVDIPSDGDTI